MFDWLGAFQGCEGGSIKKIGEPLLVFYLVSLVSLKWSLFSNYYAKFNIFKIGEIKSMVMLENTANWP